MEFIIISAVWAHALGFSHPCPLLTAHLEHDCEEYWVLSESPVTPKRLMYPKEPSRLADLEESWELRDKVHLCYCLPDLSQNVIPCYTRLQLVWTIINRVRHGYGNTHRLCRYRYGLGNSHPWLCHTHNCGITSISQVFQAESKIPLNYSSSHTFIQSRFHINCSIVFLGVAHKTQQGKYKIMY